MECKIKKIFSLCLIFTLLISSVSADFPNDQIEKTSKYLIDEVENPTCTSIGGEWTIIALARSKNGIPKYYKDKYLKNLETFVKKKKGELHDVKSTEYSRVILALSAIDKNPTCFSGYNLLSHLSDFNFTVKQGINGAIYALLALDCKNYEIPTSSVGKIQTTRQKLINYIVEHQNSDGGYSLAKGNSEPDITAMAMQALSKYNLQLKVQIANEKSKTYLQGLEKSGGFKMFGEENSESASQSIVAFSEYGLLSDSINAYEILKKFEKNGVYSHLLNEKGAVLATEQALCALVSIERLQNNKTSFYDMDEKIKFTDIEKNIYKNEIIALSKRKIISGVSEFEFQPNRNLTRAEFAVLLVKSLNLTASDELKFQDVKKTDWYMPYVGAAYKSGIINGVDANHFSPNAFVTIEHIQIMLKRALKLSANVKTNFFDADSIFTNTQRYALRGEVAYLIYNFLIITEKY